MNEGASSTLLGYHDTSPEPDPLIADAGGPYAGFGEEGVSATPAVFSSPLAPPARPTTAPMPNERAGLGATAPPGRLARRKGSIGDYGMAPPPHRPATAFVAAQQPSGGRTTPRTARTYNVNHTPHTLHLAGHSATAGGGSGRSRRQTSTARRAGLRPQTARELAGGEHVRFLEQQADRKDDGYPYRRAVIAEEVAITRRFSAWRRVDTGRSS